MHVNDTICKIYWSMLAICRNLDVIHTSGNVAMKTGGTGADPADYEIPLPALPSSQPTAGDFLYEPV